MVAKWRQSGRAVAADIDTYDVVILVQSWLVVLRVARVRDMPYRGAVNDLQDERIGPQGMAKQQRGERGVDLAGVLVAWRGDTDRKGYRTEIVASRQRDEAHGEISRNDKS